MSMKRTLSPEARKAMLADLSRVHDLVNQRDYREAAKLAHKVAGGCAWAGVRSAHVAWVLAVVHDYLGEVEEAFKFISEALAMDPLEPNALRSYDIVTDKIRRALTDADRQPADESIPRLYALLVQAQKTDEAVHVAMARHLAATGRDAGAMKVLDAITTLSPGCGDAWRLKAAVARKLGDDEQAAAAEVQASACAGASPVFGIPGEAAA